MEPKVYTGRVFAFKWIIIAFIIKAGLFFFFALNFIQNWPHGWIINSIFITAGDTGGYYDPIESWVNGLGYNTFCRMPGLLPIYGPLYWLFGAVWGKTVVIILQLCASAVSVYLLAKTAARIFQSSKIFFVCFFLYSFSSFVSIWDHYGLSDSFSTSFLIISFYFFVSYFENAKAYALILSGVFVAWSVFFRPINGIVLSCYIFIFFLNTKTGFYRFFKGSIFLALPLIVLISAWTLHNYLSFRKIVPLQGTLSECSSGRLSEDHIAIRNLIITWGGDFQEWSLGGETEWF